MVASVTLAIAENRSKIAYFLHSMCTARTGHGALVQLVSGTTVPCLLCKPSVGQGRLLLGVQGVGGGVEGLHC